MSAAPWLAVALLSTGCASGPRARVMAAVEVRDADGALDAYERFRELDGPDASLLSEVAALILEDAALSEDAALRDAAMHQLRLAGTAALPLVRRLARREGRTVARAKALEILSERGDDEARAYLYALLDADDVEIQATALGAVDAEEEPARLVEALGHESATMRKAAARALAGAGDDAAARAALAELSRVDPDGSVRNAAVRSLGGFGAAAFEPLRERLGDPESSVRLAAVRALVRADRERALIVVGPLLETPPSPAGIEAARVLAFTGEGDPAPEGVVTARAYLRRAVTSDQASLRAQAAIAIVSLGATPELDATLLEALRAEADPSVRLSMARALRQRPGAEEDAVAALRGLLSGDEMPAVQAASILAADGVDPAIAKLEAALSHGSSLIRQVAARSLAREAQRPDAVRVALRDDDPVVRVHAAGGILAAVAAR